MDRSYHHNIFRLSSSRKVHGQGVKDLQLRCVDEVHLSVARVNHDHDLSEQVLQVGCIHDYERLQLENLHRKTAKASRPDLKGVAVAFSSFYVNGHILGILVVRGEQKALELDTLLQQSVHIGR